MNRKLRTIVVEDERLPRLTLLKKLEALAADVEVVAACDSYEKARDSIRALKPDLLLMDIQLQGRDSISLLDELKEDMTLPHVIFTTAYSDREYLMSAIKLSAVDYLLKPVGKAELSHAIAKVTDRAAVRGEWPEKLVFKTVNAKLFLSADDIAGFRAEGNYATLITFGGEHLLLESLLSLEQRLRGGRFLRADRSTIVNIGKVCRLDQQLRTCTLQAADGRTLEIPLSKNGIENLSSALEANG